MLALEWRAPWEYGATLLTLPWLRRVPRGDGHPVLVFPGLAAGDMTTAALRGYLRAIGYDVHGWQLGVNRGPRAGVIDAVRQRVMRLAQQAHRKVSLVGWSLGGIYARELAKQLPAQVRCVVTLGTPFTGHPRANHAWRLYELASGLSVDEHPAAHGLHIAPPVPTTSIYSRSDGVVSWHCSVQDRRHADHDRIENIEVLASHLGLGVNPAALFALADRLAQPEGQWHPFHRDGWRALVFPAAGDGR